MARFHSNASPPDMLRGALAGFVGGIAGTWAMATTNALWNRAEAAGSPGKGQGHRARRQAHAGVGAGVHAQSEPRSHHEAGLMPSERLVEMIAKRTTGEPLSPQTRERLGSAFHYLFGAVAGAAYGALAARYPVVTAGHGTLCGATVLVLADEIGVPALGIAPSPDESPLHAHAYALAGHLGYGLALETVRQILARTDRP